MSNKKFKETRLPEDFSKALAKQSFIMGPSNVHKVVGAIIHGVSKALGSVKDLKTPKAIVFKSMNQQFLAAAIVRYIPDGDIGNWSYTWTWYEDDVADCDVIAFDNSIIKMAIANSAYELYKIRFMESDLIVLMGVIFLEQLKEYLRENSTEEVYNVVLDGVFTASSVVESDGTISYGFVPDGEMKVLIKDDGMIQEK